LQKFDEVPLDEEHGLLFKDFRFWSRLKDIFCRQPSVVGAMAEAMGHDEAIFTVAAKNPNLLLPINIKVSPSRILPADQQSIVAWNVNRRLIEARRGSRAFSWVPEVSTSALGAVAYEAGKKLPQNSQGLYMAMHLIETSATKTSPEAANRLGLSLLQRGDCVAAGQVLAVAPNVGGYKPPDLPGYLFNNYGVALQCQGRLSDAKAAFRLGAERGSALAEANYKRLEGF